MPGAEGRASKAGERMLFFGVSALFLAGIFLNAHFFWCHWLGFAGLWFLYQKNRNNFLRGFLVPCWLVFFVVYAAYLYWVLKYKFWVYGVCVLALSFLLPVFFTLYHVATRRFHSFAIDVASVFGIFVLSEFILSRLPFVGTAPLDFFFHPPFEMLRALYFIDFIVWSAWVMATCFLAAYAIYRKSLKAITFLGLSLIAMVVLINVANINTRLEKSRLRHPVKIALIQHNLPFSEEWRMDHPSEVKNKYESLALEAAKQHPDLIIFPQYTFPEDIFRKPDFFSGLAKKTGVYILTGAHVPIEAGKSILDYGFMNLALLFTPEGKLGGVYQAMEEAPFGEVRQQPAKKYQVIETPFGKLGVQLCYEDVTSKLAKEAVRAGADILVSLSNPGMFLDTHMPYYHLQQDQRRVMEAGLPLARVSPNGYSAFISKTGRIVQKTRLNEEKILYINSLLSGCLMVQLT